MNIAKFLRIPILRTLRTAAYVDRFVKLFTVCLDFMSNNVWVICIILIITVSVEIKIKICLLGQF